MNKLYIGIDNGYTGGIAVIDPAGELSHRPVLVTELGSDRALDVRGNLAILDQLLATSGVPRGQVFVAFEQSRKNPLFGAVGNYVNGKNQEFWRVLLTLAELPFCSVNPQTWQKQLFQGVRGTDTKAMAAMVVQQRFPTVAYSGYNAEKIRGVNDAILIALWAKENNK
jgi:hypothetical protein